MKKLVSLVLAAVLMLGMTTVVFAEDFELALVTDLGTIDDKSFNQGAWEGLVQYAEENSISHKYYQPKEQGTEAYLDSIQLAVAGGAKVVVTPGFLFAPAIYMAQDMYPDVHFILLDAAPNDDDWSTDAGPNYRTEKNALSILYAEEESGFLAGYSAVKEGYTKLGFMGGMAVPAVIRFGYGFVEGAEYAANELGISEVTVNYHYTGGFDATPEAQAMSASWYNDGVEVIFACGGSVGNSVMAAAAASEGKWVIGVDRDQSSESDYVLTSATKGLAPSVYQALTSFYKGEFPGGEQWVLGANRDGVSLPMQTSRFSTFAQADYDAIYAKLVAGEVTLQKDTDAAEATALPITITKVTVVQ